MPSRLRRQNELSPVLIVVAIVFSLLSSGSLRRSDSKRCWAGGGYPGDKEAIEHGTAPLRDIHSGGGTRREERTRRR